MSAAPAKLALRPQERRLVVLTLSVVFVVLNVWLVWPHFGDWTLIESRQDRARKTYKSYQAEIAKTPAYRVKLRELESAGSSVVPDEQELDLVRTVDSQARVNRLNVLQSDPRPKQSMSTQTNRFFEEQYVTLHATSDNEELVNFLVSLTTTNSLIRVKDLSLKTADAGATKLDAQMTLVASYQRKTPARGQPQSAPAVTNVPAAPKPAPPRMACRTNRPANVSAAATTNRAGPRIVPPRTRLTNQPAHKP